MKKIARLSSLFFAGLAFTLLIGTRPALGAAAEPPDGEAICTLQIYRDFPGLCPPLGPGAYLEKLAAQGITLPLRPLPSHVPPPELAINPYAYARVLTDPAPIFATLEDAVQGKPVQSWMEPGFRYVTYIDAAEVEGSRYYLIDLGKWMRGSDVTRVSGSSTFQGLEFHNTPKNAFGWVLFERQSKRTPGFEQEDYTERSYVRYQVVQIYNVTQANGEDWYLIGPDEWLEGRLVAGVFPNPTPPEEVENGRWLEVNLAEQTIAVYEDARLVFATVTATGTPGQWTRPGLFQAYKKVADETMSGSFTADRSDYYYLEGVVWTVYFDQARALHGAYWHNGFGVPLSRGCVNLSTGDAQWVFNWIQEGDWVYVWDPTGQTPTDPALYGDGGA